MLLNTQVPLFGLYSIELYHLLQYASSLLGLLVLVYWYRQLARPRPGRFLLERYRPPRAGSCSRWSSSPPERSAPSRAIARTCVSGTFYGLAYLLLTRCLAWFGLLYFSVGALVSVAERFLAGREPPEPEPVSSESP